ncbi:MAG: hypothetical protein WC467_00210 [Patescibacteria group bacterium]
MFNDLNNANGAAHPVVDDIFAETDKPSAGGIQSDIETHNVGLANSGENLPPMPVEAPMENSKGYLKIIIIAVVVIVVLGGAYFTYSQFFKSNIDGEPSSQTPAASNVAPTVDLNTAATTSPATNTEFVNEIPGMASSTVLSPVAVATTTEPGFVASSSEIIPVSTIDSDSDGLTDSEENIAGTNINVIDTDNDGLSDYEEVKIYHTNPVNADTDGDGYLDGAEVKSGYDPNVQGAKLPGNLSTN